MSWIKRAWRGEERLWIVFWLYSVLLGFFLQAASMGVLAFMGPLAHLLPVGIEIMYVVWVVVAAWRCTFNTDWKYWGYAVRGLIGLYIVSIIGIPILQGEILFAGAIDKFIAAKACEKEVDAYSARGGGNLEAFKQTCISGHLHRNIALKSYSNKPVAKTDTPPDPSDPLKDISAAGRIDAYFIAQYIHARESYDINTLVENFNIVRLMTAPKPYADFVAEADPKNPKSNAALLQQYGTRKVQLKSLAFLKPQLVEVHFTIREWNNASKVVEYNKVAQIEFEVVKMNLTPSERFINPVGFRVIQYQLSDEHL